MPNSFTIHRLVCSTPPGLEEERDLFQQSVASFAERVTMPEWVLLAPAIFIDGFDANAQQAAVKNNIRNGVFFLGIFGQDPVHLIYQRFAEYAVECAEDPALPTRRVTLVFKDAEGVAPEILALRERMSALCDVRTYGKTRELPALFEEILGSWYALLRT